MKYTHTIGNVRIESDDLQQFAKLLESLGVDYTSEYYPSSSRGLVRYKDMSLQHLAFALRKRAMTLLEGATSEIRQTDNLSPSKVISLVVSPEDAIYKNLLAELYRRHKLDGTTKAAFEWYKV